MLNRLFNRIIKRTFPIWQQLGVHVIPNHFYEPIPDTRYLPNKLWVKRLNLQGLDFREKEQLKLLNEFKTYKKEYSLFPLQKKEDGFFINNGMFESVDAEVLYYMVRDYKPSKVIEVGSGFSSLLIAQARAENKAKSKHIIIDPYPSNIYENKQFEFSNVIKKPVQDVSLKTFGQLGKNDILFIDSSHIVKIGSDVQYEILEILPRLKKGVIIHFHDIFLPNEYPKKHVLEGKNFWNEQYFLHTFLMFNPSFRILWAANYMHAKHSRELSSAFKSYNKTRNPGSFWIRRTK